MGSLACDRYRKHVNGHRLRCRPSYGSACALELIELFGPRIDEDGKFSGGQQVRHERITASKLDLLIRQLLHEGKALLSSHRFKEAVEPYVLLVIQTHFAAPLGVQEILIISRCFCSREQFCVVTDHVTKNIGGDPMSVRIPEFAWVGF